MNRFKRQVSPGAAAFLVVVVLFIVQYAWWRGLIYRPAGPPGGPPSGSSAQLQRGIVLVGKRYVDVITLAGLPDPGNDDGPGYAARFDRPTGIALDSTGSLYVCDTGNHRIRLLRQDGSVTTVAGSDQGFADGPAGQAKFNAPCGICLASDGDLYVSDTGNARIRRIHNGQVSTVVSVQEPPGSSLPWLPIEIQYVKGTSPGLFVLDAGKRTTQMFGLNGKPEGAQSKVNSLAIISQHDLSALTLSKTVLPIEGSEELDDVARRPAIKNIIAWCDLGSGALAADPGHGAIFYVKNGVAGMLVGIAQDDRSVHDWRDGNGEVSLFGKITCLVTDGKRYVYAADTSNNCIRRLALPDFMFN